MSSNPSEIVQSDNPVLRQHTKAIPIHEIGSKPIQNIIARMKKALESQEDGVGLAASQIGEPLSIFVISHRVFDQFKDESKTVDNKDVRELSNTPSDKSNKGEKDNKKSSKKVGDMVFINPVIKKLSREKRMMEEGCLSVRPLYGKVKRSVKATITAYNEKGEKFEMGASGLLAQIFQHEVDHLYGTLFIDKAVDLFEMDLAHTELS